MINTPSSSRDVSATECIIDVGANVGDFLFPAAERSPNIRVIGIEPIPGLVEYLQNKRSVREFKNVEIWPCAVDVEERTAKFNLSQRGEYGVSSLLDFDAETLQHHEYWVGRSDLVFDDVIEVEVRRLDALLSAAGIERVRFIKIDAQGLDLDVLESAGEFLDRIDAGMLEVPTVRNARLYKDEATLQSAFVRLGALGFEAYAIKPNDPANAEVNIFFCRHGVDWREVETSLSLRGMALYDGKHYWHVPSDSPQPPEASTREPSSDEVLRADQEIRVENAMAWAALGRERTRVVALQREVAALKGQIAVLSQVPDSQPLPVVRRRPLPIRIVARATRPFRQMVRSVR